MDGFEVDSCSCADSVVAGARMGMGMGTANGEVRNKHHGARGGVKLSRRRQRQDASRVIVQNADGQWVVNGMYRVADGTFTQCQ